MSKKNCTRIFVDGRAVGSVKEGVFEKRIQASRHFLRKPRAIALDVSSLDEAEKAGATLVRVTDTESGTVFTASVAHIRNRGFAFNRGFGSQIGLALEGWTRQGAGELQQLMLFA